MRAVGLFPLVVATGCLVANPAWQAVEDSDTAGDGKTTGMEMMGDSGVGPTSADDTMPATTLGPTPQTGTVDDGETMGPIEWWDNGWQYRRKIDWVLQGAGTEAPGLPVSVDVYSLGLDDEFALGGQDIRIVTSSGEILSSEIDHWSDALLEGVVWFRLPESSPDDPELWLYHGNPTVAEPMPLTPEVFANNYIAVWHMEGPLDSSPYPQSIDMLPLVEGYIGNGMDLNGDHSGFRVQALREALLGLPMSEFTFSAMVYPTVIQEVGVLFEVSSQGEPLLRIGINSGYQVHLSRFQPGEPEPTLSLSSQDTLFDGFWNHVIVRHSSESTQIHIDGFESGVVGEDTMVGEAMSGDEFQIGAGANDTAVFRGMLDEVRVANVVRDEGWVQWENDAVELGLTSLGNLEVRP